MRARYLSTIALVGACGAANVKRETIGGGATNVQARGAVEPVQSGGIALPRGAYELRLHFTVPRMQLVEWSITCPGVSQAGFVGQPLAGDDGAGPLEASVAVLTSDDGTCSVGAIADDPNVVASYEVFRDAEAHRQRLHYEALQVRGSLRAYLIALGAHLRPPMPPRPPEDPGTPPFEDAIWIGGEWRWTGVEWLWERGGWGSSGPRVRDHRTSSWDDNVRDHRDEQVSTVRDHRTAPEVRDHRSESKHESKSAPIVRDHRDDDKQDSKKDDDGPKVRDHRH